MFWRNQKSIEGKGGNFSQDPEIDTSILFEDKNATVILLVYHAPQLETFEVPHVVPLQTILIYIAHIEMPQTDKFYHTYLYEACTCKL